MVSLLKLSEMSEEGVKFYSPHDNTPMLLTPEKSIAMQNAIGADIIMQLDDVVAPTESEERLEEAMWRSIRWLDRCIKVCHGTIHKKAHARPKDQNLYPIIQGGLNLEWRKTCIQEMVKRNCPGYAIGGLSGGEEKDRFWRVYGFFAYDIVGYPLAQTIYQRINLAIAWALAMEKISWFVQHWAWTSTTAFFLLEQL